jgi:hypothetical protein
MEQVVDAAVATPRSMAWLLSMFAASALLLAAIGLRRDEPRSQPTRVRSACEWQSVPALAAYGRILGKG